MRESFRKRAEGFERELEDAAPAQLEYLAGFAARAFRRPLRAAERAEFDKLYDLQRKKGVGHEEAFRTVLAACWSRRRSSSTSSTPRRARSRGRSALGARQPAELFPLVHHPRRRTAPPRRRRQAARASSSRTANAAHAAGSAAAVTGGRIRTQWIHVRGFDELKEKNEALFPTFNDELRKAIYEESILFFQDLFQHDRPVTRIIDADDTYLNETLAKHYGIPGVVGPQCGASRGEEVWAAGSAGAGERADQGSRASRTSPVLRGNWVVETLLGEKLPRPPANVPRLPEDERGNEGLTVRQLVAKHTSIPECAVCHVRIDPFGFALERYDPIGRRRDRDLGGLPIDTHVKLKDGNEFDGIDGLRQYLLTKKQDVIVRLFCRSYWVCCRPGDDAVGSAADRPDGRELNKNEAA